MVEPSTLPGGVAETVGAIAAEDVLEQGQPGAAVAGGEELRRVKNGVPFWIVMAHERIWPVGHRKRQSVPGSSRSH